MAILALEEGVPGLKVKRLQSRRGSKRVLGRHEGIQWNEKEGWWVGS